MRTVAHASVPVGVPLTGALHRALSRLARGLGAGLKRLQYAQMIAALERLPDRHLKQAGLRRCDIPEHARRAIYGEE